MQKVLYLYYGGCLFNVLGDYKVTFGIHNVPWGTFIPNWVKKEAPTLITGFSTDGDRVKLFGHHVDLKLEVREDLVASYKRFDSDSHPTKIVESGNQFTYTTVNGHSVLVKDENITRELPIDPDSQTLYNQLKAEQYEKDCQLECWFADGKMSVIRSEINLNSRSVTTWRGIFESLFHRYYGDVNTVIHVFNGVMNIHTADKDISYYIKIGD